jgi:hypothetical protein
MSYISWMDVGFFGKVLGFIFGKCFWEPSMIFNNTSYRISYRIYWSGDSLQLHILWDFYMSGWRIFFWIVVVWDFIKNNFGKVLGFIFGKCFWEPSMIFNNTSYSISYSIYWSGDSLQLHILWDFYMSGWRIFFWIVVVWDFIEK